MALFRNTHDRAQIGDCRWGQVSSCTSSSQTASPRVRGAARWIPFRLETRVEIRTNESSIDPYGPWRSNTPSIVRIGPETAEILGESKRHAKLVGNRRGHGCGRGPPLLRRATGARTASPRYGLCARRAALGTARASVRRRSCYDESELRFRIEIRKTRVEISDVTMCSLDEVVCFSRTPSIVAKSQTIRPRYDIYGPYYDRDTTRNKLKHRRREGGVEVARALARRRLLGAQPRVTRFQTSLRKRERFKTKARAASPARCSSEASTAPARRASTGSSRTAASDVVTIVF